MVVHCLLLTRSAFLQYFDINCRESRSFATLSLIGLLCLGGCGDRLSKSNDVKAPSSAPQSPAQAVPETETAAAGSSASATADPVDADDPLILETDIDSVLTTAPSLPAPDLQKPFSERLLLRAVDLLERNINGYVRSVRPHCTVAGRTDIVVLYKVVRGVADWLAVGSRLAEHATDAVLKQRILKVLDSGAAFVRANHTSMDNTAYNQCYGGSVEAMTNYHVARGLYEYYALTKDVAAKQHADLMFEQWQSGKQYTLDDGTKTSFLRWWGAESQKSIGPPWKILPNYGGQVLTVGVLRNRLGHSDGLPGWIAEAVDKVASMQDVVAVDARCTGVEGSLQATPAVRNLLYGGWAHARWTPETSDCAQKMGYHRLTVEGYLDLHRLLVEKAACSGVMAAVCAKSLTVQAASLAWIHQLRRADGAYASMAPTSTFANLTEADYKSGTPIALQTIFEVLGTYAALKKSHGVALPASFKAGFGSQTLTLAEVRSAAMASAEMALTANMDVLYFASAYLAMVKAEAP